MEKILIKMEENNLKLFRLIHKDESKRVGAVVIGRNVEVLARKSHRRPCVIVDGVPYVDFCGASFICDLDEETSKDYLGKIKKDVLNWENIGK